MIYNYYPISLDMPLKDFLARVLWTEEISLPIQHSLSIDLLEKFQIAGCDYYALLAIASSVNSFSEKELETLISLSPKSIAHLTASQKNIRECIPRWTSSRYHTAPIAKIVEEIHKLLTENESGVTVFNSNLNLRNTQAVKDQYILLISKEHRIFLDINRKTTTSFNMD